MALTIAIKNLYRLFITPFIYWSCHIHRREEEPIHMAVFTHVAVKIFVGSRFLCVAVMNSQSVFDLFNGHLDYSARLLMRVSPKEMTVGGYVCYCHKSCVWRGGGKQKKLGLFFVVSFLIRFFLCSDFPVVFWCNRDIFFPLENSWLGSRLILKRANLSGTCWESWKKLGFTWSVMYPGWRLKKSRSKLVKLRFSGLP